MIEELVIFDYAQTVGVTACLMITIPLASFVYSKLLFAQPFSTSYTFKLIVLNGSMELLNTLDYLFVYQLTSFSFAINFYVSVQEAGLATPLAIMNAFLGGMALHTSFFIAVNRTKTMILFHRQSNDHHMFIFSVILSIVLTLPSLLDFCYTTSVYNYVKLGNETVIFPGLIITNDVFRTISYIIRVVISLSTFLINMFLVVLIMRERKFISIAERRKFKVEKGLVITSIIAYSTYMVHFANTLISRYFKVTFSGYAQWLFLGIKSLSPFWCLIIFTPSVSRIITRKKETPVPTMQFQTRTALN